MEDERLDVSQDSSPVDDSSDSSTENLQESEPTEEQGTEEKQHEPIPYDRFREVIEQKNQTAQELEHWRTVATQLTDKFQHPTSAAPTKQEVDIIQKYGAQDPATREFLRELKAEMRSEANRVADERAAPIIRENEALRRTVAAIQEKEFRRENKDVLPNSQEEKEIAQMVQMGIPLDRATKAVMYDKRLEEARSGARTKVKQQTKTKADANLERTSIPRSSGLPQEREESFREKADRMFKEAGL